MSINSNTNQTNYSNSKIYKIVSFKTDQVYVGSTTKHYLSQRMTWHRSDYKKWLSNSEKYDYITSFEILKHDDADIILIETYPCASKLELKARERYWIETLNTVNKVIPGRTMKEYQETNKDAIHKYKNQQNKCECGSMYSLSNKSHHLRTIKHKTYIANKNNISTNIINVPQ